MQRSARSIGLAVVLGLSAAVLLLVLAGGSRAAQAKGLEGASDSARPEAQAAGLDGHAARGEAVRGEAARGEAAGVNADSGSARALLSVGLQTTPAFTATGLVSGTEFGVSVATAGDVNGDGYADFIVGANSSIGGIGRAFVFEGGHNGLGQTPAVTLTGESGGNFGSSVATAGDVNGDGYADVVVGALTTFSGISQTGQAYIYLGGPGGLSATPALTLTGETSDDKFGNSVAPAGDVNGDGYADVAVSARGFSDDTGRVYVYHGGPAGLSATPALTRTGENAGDEFGASVATAGDVNGDGFADVVVGAGGYNGGTGRVYVFTGSVSGLAATPALTLTGSVGGEQFGGGVATTGDVNCDGYADVVVGAANSNGGDGAAYVYTGGAAGLSATAALTLTGASGSAGAFGKSVAPAGDMNGDGYADLVVGAYLENANDGAAYVYTGSAAGLSASRVLTLTGASGVGSLFGGSVAPAGDVNGDGYADLGVGASQFNVNQGRAFVFHGAAGTASALPVRTFTGEASSNLFGASVATAGDVNGDGYADMLAGAPGYSGGTGRVYVYHGGASGLAASPSLTLTGEPGVNNFGSSVATAGDVNGDGYADVVIGSAYNFGQGRAYVYYGSAGGLGATPALTLTGEAGDDNFGNSVATAGDVNGDGYADVVIGAVGHSGFQGLAFIYEGGSSGLGATPTLTLTGEAGSDFFGTSVATAGDVNGDGYADVVIGATGHIINTGRAYVYHGSAGGLGASPALTLTGEASEDYFGGSAATAGDVNGDGYADVVVGALGYSGSRGRAYVYQGGAGGLGATPALTLTGEASINLFGRSAGGAGDVNGDGYADVIVGAFGYSSFRGRAYLYHGGAGGLGATPALTLTGEAISNDFGESVATAGDVNGDGYAEVVIGASGNSGNTGRAYVYAGNERLGMALRARTRQADDTDPIAYLGRSETFDTFRVLAAGCSPFGRGRVKLEVEVKPLGTAFDGSGTTSSANWIDSGVAGAELDELVNGLTRGTVYHWRVRVRYDPTGTPFQQYSRWLTQPWNGWEEARLRTASLVRLFLPLVRR